MLCFIYNFTTDYEVYLVLQSGFLIKILIHSSHNFKIVITINNIKLQIVGVLVIFEVSFSNCLFTMLETTSEQFLSKKFHQYTNKVIFIFGNDFNYIFEVRKYALNYYNKHHHLLFFDIYIYVIIYLSHRQSFSLFLFFLSLFLSLFLLNSHTLSIALFQYFF